MSPTLPDQTHTASRWTPEVVLGLLALLASMILPYLDMPTGVATACGLFAAWLLGPIPSPFSPRPGGGERGGIDVGALGALAGVAFAAVLIVAALFGGACGSTYQAEHRAVVDWTPGPPCHLEVRLDGEARPVVTVDAPEACEPPPDVCPEVRP